MSEINVIIDGMKIKGEKGDTILSLSSRQGIIIPSICHDPRLKPANICNLCIVEIEGCTEPVPACSTFIEENMIVRTTSDRILQARKKAYQAIDKIKRKSVDDPYPVNFYHPYVVMDNTKCILCLRCVRICAEVAGVRAIDAVNTVSGKYVVPAKGKFLPETSCESCGLCISTCPTGAIYSKSEIVCDEADISRVKSVCNYCSLGCSIELHQYDGTVFKVEGTPGAVNTDGNICYMARFGFKYLNRKDRITKPLLKEGNTFRPISFQRAYDIIAQKIKSVEPSKNAFFAGGRLSSEQQYLIGKLARSIVQTPAIGSFLYLNGGENFGPVTGLCSSLSIIKKAKHIILLGTQTNLDHPVAGYMVSNMKEINGAFVDVITVIERSSMDDKADSVTLVSSYYHLLRAMNHYLVSNGKLNTDFIMNCTSGFDEYRDNLLAEDYKMLTEKSGIESSVIESLSDRFFYEEETVVIFSEKEVSTAACRELLNLIFVTGKPYSGKSGIIPLSEKNNANGLFYNGIFQTLIPGNKDMTDIKAREFLKSIWKSEIPEAQVQLVDALDKGMFNNLFIFGEDPIGCSYNWSLLSDWLSAASFLVVQDYFLTDTALMAHLVLPASFPVEESGSFVNATGIIQQYLPVVEPVLEHSSFEQLQHIAEVLGADGDLTLESIRNEIDQFYLFDKKDKAFIFNMPLKRYSTRLFEYGCDYLSRYFDDEFYKAFL